MLRIQACVDNPRIAASCRWVLKTAWNSPLEAGGRGVWDPHEKNRNTLACSTSSISKSERPIRRPVAEVVSAGHQRMVHRVSPHGPISSRRSAPSLLPGLLLRRGHERVLRSC
jgi:hypothetical protein